MMTFRVGMAGGLAAAAAMAAHLNQRTVPEAQLVLAEYYAGGPERRARAEAALAAGMASLPTVRPDIDPALAKALAIEGGEILGTEELGHVLRGQAADGEDLPGAHHDVRVYRSADGDTAKDRARISYMDLTFSAPKSVSVAWFAAKTDAERNSIVAAHRGAVAQVLRYIEAEVGIAGFGKGHRQGGTEAARMAWIEVLHFTSRATQTITRADPTTGVVDTELYDIPERGLVKGDPQLHSHCIVPNVMLTDSGRFAAMNRNLFDDRVKEFGATYQMLLAAELRAIGIDVALDQRTLMARLPAIPEAVCQEFSKRTERALEAAREMAKEHGLNWDTLDPDRKVLLLKGQAQATRIGKGDDLASWEAWEAQVEQLIRDGKWWHHESAIAYGPPAPARTDDERFDHAYEVGTAVLAPELDKRAVISGADVRLACARGLIEAGAEGVEDIRTLARGMGRRGVLQDGRLTKMLYREQGGGRLKVTTELHRDQEADVIRLARDGAADRSRALPLSEVRAAMAAMAKVDYTTDHGIKQRDLIERVAPGGEVNLFLGSAGVGKTSAILPPLVKAWQAHQRDVWGVANAWKAATGLREAGIDAFRTRALQPFLDGVEAGRTELTRNSVVVLDELSQVGTRQLLHLLRLRDRIGFSLVMTGDERQCQSIEAGPVIELLRRALGAEAIPEILSTIRQKSEDEQKIAALFRVGTVEAAAEGIRLKREAGDAVLVPGTYQDCIDAVANRWAERVRAMHNDPEYTVTISAPSNADALNISRACRALLQAEGRIGRDAMERGACDGAGNLYSLALAVGDKVRLFQRTRGRFTDAQGRARDAHAGDNGSVLTVRGIEAEGLRLETESGKVALVTWDRLTDRVTGRLKLALGYCLTIDSSQGITSDEHIWAMPAGSAGVQAFKAYVAASRHRVAAHLIGSAGAEMMEVGQRRPLGPRQPVSQDEAWANVARNLGRAPLKELATDMLAMVARQADRAGAMLRRVARGQEDRARRGQDVSTLPDNIAWERGMEALAELADRLEQAMRGRAPLLAQLAQTVAQAVPRRDTEVRMAEQYRIHVRAVAAGSMALSGAVDAVLAVELDLMGRDAPLDPVHRTPKVGLGVGDVEAMEDRIMQRMASLLDAYAEQGEAALGLPRRVPRREDQAMPEVAAAPASRPMRRVNVTMAQAQEQLADALRSAGFDLQGKLPVLDGERHYVRLDGAKGKKKQGAYRAYYDGIRPAGSIINYKTGHRTTWKAGGDYVPITAEQAERFRAEAAQQKALREADRLINEAGAARRAAAIWKRAKPAQADHPYLVRKRVAPEGLRQDKRGWLIVPLYTARGELVNLQRIAPDGTKLVMEDARKAGAFFVLGTIRPNEPIIVAEGLATAATIYRATGAAVVMAIDAGNLKPVALDLRAAHPGVRLLFAADNDAHLPARKDGHALENIGLVKAREAAAEVDGEVLLSPEIIDRTAADTGTDWNDYAEVFGEEGVRRSMAGALPQMRRVERPGHDVQGMSH